MSEGNGKPQLSVEQFVDLAVTKLRNGNYKGIHAVYSGFNAAFRKYFPELDPVVEVQKLVDEGKYVTRPVKGGVTIYRAGDVETPIDDKKALEKMGL